jgi:hypothetical protein
VTRLKAPLFNHDPALPRSVALTSKKFSFVVRLEVQLLIAQRLVVTDFLKLLLVLTTAFAVRSEIVAAILDQLLPDFLTLRMTIPLEGQHGKQ